MTEKMKPSGFDYLGNIPASWDAKRFKYCVQICNGGEYADIEVEEGGYPVIGSGGEFARASKYCYRGESVLLGRKGTVDKPLYVNDAFWCVDTMFYTKAKQGMIPKFLYYCALCFRFDYYVTATALPSMTQKDLGSEMIAVPPTNEQQAIADFLDAQCAKIDSVIADIEKQIETLQRYKKSLITEIVTKGLDQSVPMMDSGIEWIGKIPSHWRVIRITKYLDSLVDYRGKTPEKVDDGVFLVTARNIKNGIVDYSLSQEYVAAEEYEQIMHRGKPEIGDVLFTTEAPLGEVANVDRTDIALAQRVIKFSGRKGCVDNYYLKYWLMSLGFQSFLWSLATGSTALGIAASKLGQLKMVLPPIDEQKAIAERLDCDCTNIDAIIVEKRKQLETAQQYKKSLIYEYVTGKKRVTEVN